jgi:hypothetical protein
MSGIRNDAGVADDVKGLKCFSGLCLEYKAVFALCCDHSRPTLAADSEDDCRGLMETEN